MCRDCNAGHDRSEWATRGAAVFAGLIRPKIRGRGGPFWDWAMRGLTNSGHARIQAGSGEGHTRPLVTGVSRPPEGGGIIGPISQTRASEGNILKVVQSRVPRSAHPVFALCISTPGPHNPK